MNSNVQKHLSIIYNHSLIRYIIALIVTLFLSILPQTVHSQASPISVSLNHDHYTTDDLVILSVTVINDGSPQQLRPILPPLDGLAIIDFDIATSVREISGRIQTESIYTYELQPRRTGSITIPPIAVEVDGQVYQARPLSITVSQGNAPAPSPGNAATPGNVIPPAGLQGQDFFVESVVDLSAPYIGQQIIYTFRFYQAIKLYRKPQYEMPIFNGLDTVGLPVREYNLDAARRTYLVTEIRTTLFPEVDGKIVIGPALLAFPGNFFEEPVELLTEPVILDVKNLPGDAPSGFNGAVGQYEIEAWVSPQVAVTNQTSTLQVAISGAGNIHALPEPIWPRLNGWRTYDSMSSLTTDMKDGVMSGTRVYERLIVSNRIGDFTIPQTKFVYFDPTAAEYRTIASKSLTVRVIPAPTPDPAAATALASTTQPTATPVPPLSKPNPSQRFDDQPVNQIFPDSLGSGLTLILPIAFVLFWAICGAIPIAAIVGAGGFWLWQQQQRQLELKPKELEQPAKKMHPELAAALAENDDNYRAVSQALTIYLGNVLQTSVKGLTRTELANRLQNQGLSKALTDRVEDYLARSEMGRFGPGGENDGWELLAKTDELLIELDKVFGE